MFLGESEFPVQPAPEGPAPPMPSHVLTVSWNWYKISSGPLVVPTHLWKCGVVGTWEIIQGDLWIFFSNFVCKHNKAAHLFGNLRRGCTKREVERSLQPWPWSATRGCFHRRTLDSLRWEWYLGSEPLQGAIHEPTAPQQRYLFCSLSCRPDLKICAQSKAFLGKEIGATTFCLWWVLCPNTTELSWPGRLEHWLAIPYCISTPKSGKREKIPGGKLQKGIQGDMESKREGNALPPPPPRKGCSVGIYISIKTLLRFLIFVLKLAR